MNTHRFDSLSRRLARGPISRRRALKAATAGLAAIALPGGASLTRAQDATPVAPLAEDPNKPAFLFVQLAESGTWAPKPGEAGVFLLTLRGTGEQTLYFSDRPERIVGTMDTDRFLNGLGFTPVNPPNAALVVQTPEGTRDVIVVELLNPTYTRSFGDDSDEWLTYEAIVLNAYQGEGLAEWTPDVDDSLFIDDCADMEGCYADKRPPGSDGWFTRTYIGPVPGGPYGRCFQVAKQICEPCTWLQFDRMCNEAYPGTDGCDGMCYTDTCRFGGTC
jgi:hypothetical protein